jgi:hypothetical protein
VELGDGAADDSVGVGDAVVVAARGNAHDAVRVRKRRHRQARI